MSIGTFGGINAARVFPTSLLIRVDPYKSAVRFLLFRSRAMSAITCDHGDRRALRADPPGLFLHFLLQTKALPQIDPCATLGWPLGGPCVAPGWPLGGPNPIPSRQRAVGCFHLPNYQITHLPNPAVRTWQPDPASDFVLSKSFLSQTHPWALLEYSYFVRPYQ